MPRRLVHPSDPHEQAQRELEAFVKPGKHRRRVLDDGAPARVPSAHRRAAAKAMLRMMEDGDWRATNAAVLVALYAWCHEHVYGVAPAELRQDWEQAEQHVQALVREEFRNSYQRAVEYVQWVWKREKWKRSQQRDGGADVRRISWRLLFKSRHLVTDWRMANLEQPAQAR